MSAKKKLLKIDRIKHCLAQISKFNLEKDIEDLRALSMSELGLVSD